MRDLAVAEEQCVVGRWRGFQPVVPGLARLKWVLFCLASVADKVLSRMPQVTGPEEARPPSAGEQES